MNIYATRRRALGAACSVLAAALLALPGLAGAQDSGLSPAGVQKINDWMRAEVASGKIPGAVLMIWRGGKPALVEVVGQRDPAQPAPLKVDDIFRIYSMTKPIVSVAAMMLVEEGKIDLDAPVAKYIPAFAELQVGVEQTGVSGQKTLELVPAQRPVTVRDLQRHTSGLTYGFFGPGLVKQAYRESGLESSPGIDNAQFADRIARLPLGPTSPAAPGTTATAPTCSAAWWRWLQVSRWAHS